MEKPRRLKIINYVAKTVNNFSVSGLTSCDITLTQPLTSDLIIKFSQYAQRNKFNVTINNKTFTFNEDN